MLWEFIKAALKLLLLTFTDFELLCFPFRYFQVFILIVEKEKCTAPTKSSWLWLCLLRHIAILKTLGGARGSWFLWHVYFLWDTDHFKAKYKILLRSTLSINQVSLDWICKQENRSKHCCDWRQSAACIPAHFKEEAVSPSHPLQLVFVLFQEIDVTFLRDELKQLQRYNTVNKHVYNRIQRKLPNYCNIY